MTFLRTLSHRCDLADDKVINLKLDDKVAVEFDRDLERLQGLENKWDMEFNPLLAPY